MKNPDLGNIQKNDGGIDYDTRFCKSYISNGIKTTLTIEDDHYDNLPYKLADMFAKVIRESDANPQKVIDNLKNAFEYEQ